MSRSRYVRSLVMGRELPKRETQKIEKTVQAGGITVNINTSGIEAETVKQPEAIIPKANNIAELTIKVKKDWTLAGPSYRAKLIEEAAAIGFKLSGYNRTLSKGDEVITF